MTDTNKKLREAFETYITDDGKWPNAILKAPGGQYLLLRTSVAWHDWKACAEALAPPTADHIPDAGEMVVDHLPDAGKMIETAAPVGERELFEREAVRSGYSVDKYAGTSIYADISTARAYEWWQSGRAALSAGDAVDAQRYRLVRRGQHFSVINGIGDTLRGEALDAAADAAIRARGESVGCSLSPTESEAAP